MIFNKNVFCLTAVLIVLVQPACSSQIEQLDQQLRPWNDVRVVSLWQFRYFMIKQSFLSEYMCRLNTVAGGPNSFIRSEKYTKSIAEVMRTAITDCALRQHEYSNWWNRYGYAYRAESDNSKKSQILLDHPVEFDVTPDKLSSGYERKHWNAFILYNLLNYTMCQVSIAENNVSMDNFIKNIESLSLKYIKSVTCKMTSKSADEKIQFLRDQASLIKLAAQDIKRYADALNLRNYLSELKKAVNPKEGPAFQNIPHIGVMEDFKEDFVWDEQARSIKSRYTGSFWQELISPRICYYTVCDDGYVKYFQTNYDAMRYFLTTYGTYNRQMGDRNKRLGQKSREVSNQNMNFNNNRNFNNNNQNRNFNNNWNINNNLNNNQLRNFNNQNMPRNNNVSFNNNQNMGDNIQLKGFNSGGQKESSNSFLRKIREELNQEYWKLSLRQSGTTIHNLCHSISSYNGKTNKINQDYENMTVSKCYFNSTMQVLANSRPIIERVRKFKELEEKPNALMHLQQHIRTLTSVVSDIMLSTYDGMMDGAVGYISPSLIMPPEAEGNSEHPFWQKVRQLRDQYDETPVQKYCDAIKKIQEASNVQDNIMWLNRGKIPNSIWNDVNERLRLQHWKHDQGAGYGVRACLHEIMPMLDEGLRFNGKSILLIECDTTMMSSKAQTEYNEEFMNGGVIQIPNSYPDLMSFLNHRYNNNQNPDRYVIKSLPPILLFTSLAKWGGPSGITPVNAEIKYPETFSLQCNGKKYTYQINGYVYCQTEKGDHFMPCLRTKDGWYTIDDRNKDKCPTKLMDRYDPDFEEYVERNQNLIKHKWKELASYEVIKIE